MFPMMLLILIISSNVSAGANVTKKLDQTLMPQEQDTKVECGSCPCVNPCAQLPPPPPPTTICSTPTTTICSTPLTPPPPPPPTTTCCTPLTPPPPPPPTTKCCTPLTPPPPRFAYFTNEPGSVYVADPYDQGGFYNGAAQGSTSWFLLLVAVGILNRL